MAEWNGRQRGSHGRQTGGYYRPRSAPGAADGFNTEEIFELHNRPELRMQDNPAHVSLSGQLIVEPNDPHLQELLSLVVRGQTEQAMQANNDPFWGNYPAKGSVPVTESTVVVGTMPTGDKIGFERDHTCSIGIFGRPRIGKTTLLGCVVPPLVTGRIDSVIGQVKPAAQGICVVVLEPKKELRRWAGLPELEGSVTVLVYDEMMISLCQPPPGVTDEIWANDLTSMTAGCYGRRGAERLLRDILGETMVRKTLEGYPPLHELLQAVEAFRPRFGMREAAYKESISSILKDLMNHTGGPTGVFGYRSSDFLEKLFSRPGLVIIEVGTLPTHHRVFLMTYMMRWLYVRRLYEK